MKPRKPTRPSWTACSNHWCIWCATPWITASKAPGSARAAGKPETATISIEASRIGDRFLIEVTDDGRGIDPAVVRRKASEKRLVPADELAALTDEQVVDLVFAPGFSTAAEVSDISGRGIGMDVVRTVVEQIGGRVSLASRVGTGTTVRLDLPMTIAMSRIMVVEAGGQLFGISMDAVSETVRVTPDRISQIKNNLGFVLRERIVPIVSLGRTHETARTGEGGRCGEDFSSSWKLPAGSRRLKSTPSGIASMSSSSRCRGCLRTPAAMPGPPCWAMDRSCWCWM